MNGDEFEGTLVLEKLAEIAQVDAFFELVDADDLEGARDLMVQAGVDRESIDTVLKMIAAGDIEKDA